MTDRPQNKNHDEQFEEKAKERLKERKEKAKKKRPEYKKKRVFVPVTTAVILILTGIFLAIHATFYQSTDDAFVEGRLISVAPRVSGPVINLLVDDNDVVKAGQLLVEIDPADYEVKLHQAEAKLAEAKAQLNVTEKQIEEGGSNVQQSYEDVTSARSKLDFAAKDHKRYTDMYKEGIVSKQDFDNSQNQYTVAQANHKAATEKSKAMESALESHKAKAEAVQAEIKRLEAEVEQAKLNLSYTKIYAPQSGMVSARSVEKGNYLQIGQPLMNIVPEHVWVIANFKEIQLTPQIGLHDLETKVKAAIKFLEDGNKVKVGVRFKGRQMSHTEIGDVTMAKFLDYVKDYSNIEKKPTLDGRWLTCVLASKTKK